MTRSIKVAYLLGSLNRGGAETMLLDLMNQHATAPFRMIGICRKKGDLYENFLNSGVTFIQLSNRNKLHEISYLIRLRQLLKKNKINIIHAHQSIDTLYGYLASIGLHVKIIQTVHGFDFQSGIYGKLIKFFSFIVANTTIFVSISQKKYYSQKYVLKQKKIQVIYNGIDLKRFSTNQNSSLRNNLGISSETFLMGMVANFSPGKDHMTICKFLLLLNRIEFNFMFLFIGGLNLSYPDIFLNCVEFCERNGLRNKVSFLGQRDDVPELLSQLDLFIFSTNHDAFGNSVIEAMVSGIPVIVNDWDVMKEIFGNGGKAIIYESKNDSDLLNKFITFYSNIEKFRQKSNENADWIKTNFCINKHIDNLHRVYNSVL